MTYSEKLKDPRWQKKRLEVLQRDNFTCKKCGFDTHTLVIHHLKYTGEPWEADMSILDTLCVHCHAIVEMNKKYYKFDYQDFAINKFIKEVSDNTKFCMIYSFDEYFCMDILDSNCNFISTMRTAGQNVKRAIKKHLRNG